MPDIENYSVYNDRMRLSMWDKAFFMDKIPQADLIVDFGCADGSLIRFLHAMFPTIMFIGYDIDPEMIARANAEKDENTWFFSTLPEVTAHIAALGLEGDRIAVNFSSVLHEVFHYLDDYSGVTEFVGALAPRYVVVRDMMYVSDDDAAPAPEKAVCRLREMLPAKQIADFEIVWGPIGVRRNMVHLLLKYKYTENWARECEENYFSYSMDDLLAVVGPEGGYRPILYHRYVLPWCRRDMEATLGIDPGSELTTHFALILEKQSSPECISLDINKK